MSKIRQWLDRHLVAEARDWWRLWSVRLNALGLAVLALITFDPVSVLGLWNMMPSGLRGALPVAVFQSVAAALFALGLIARLVRQPKLEARRDQAQ